MAADLGDLTAFVAVARAGGFRAISNDVAGPIIRATSSTTRACAVDSQAAR